jgi:hypothetical protein
MEVTATLRLDPHVPDACVKDSPGVYALLAVLVPVALGLGLIYLAIMGSLDHTSALVAIVASAMLIPLVAILADLSRKDESSRRRPRHRRSSRVHVQPAVHGEVGAGNVGGVLGSEEGDRVGHLFGHRETPGGNL